MSSDSNQRLLSPGSRFAWKIDPDTGAAVHVKVRTAPVYLYNPVAKRTLCVAPSRELPAASWEDAKVENNVFDTGAQRSKDVEGYRFDLISYPALRVIAKVLHEGAQKYDAFNWEMGMPINDILIHAINHIYAFLDGDRSEDHLGHAFCNMMFAVHGMQDDKFSKSGLRPPKGTDNAGETEDTA